MSVTILPSPGVRPGIDAGQRGAGEKTAWLSAAPFLAVNAAPIGAFFVVVSWQDWVLAAALYATRMLLVTAGYHRYFSHRSFRVGRVGQFVVAVAGTTAAQKGPLWWAGHHRVHHRFTDRYGDVHSPRDGIWWSHVGWILSTRYKRADLEAIRDFAAYPELRAVDRFHWVGPWVVGAACFAVGGWGALLVGFLLSTVLLWHGTFVVNSLAHLVGRRRYATPDTSRNSLLLSLITGGEGWHNNHHYLPASARQGFAWWEVDPTWYVLRILAALRIVRDLRVPPRQLLEQARVRDGAFDIGMFRAYWERAARVAGARIADLGGRHAAPTGPDAELLSEVIASGDHGEAASLPGLIRRVLESADQLATATRRRPVPAATASGPKGTEGQRQATE